MNKEGTQINEPKDKEVDDYGQGFTSERWRRQTVSRKKRAEENLPALRIALMRQYKDSRSTLKREKKD